MSSNLIKWLTTIDTTKEKKKKSKKEKKCIEKYTFILYKEDFEALKTNLLVCKVELVGLLKDLESKIEYITKENNYLLETISKEEYDKVKGFSLTDLKYKFTMLSLLKDRLNSSLLLQKSIKDLNKDTTKIDIIDFQSGLIFNKLDSYYTSYTKDANNNKLLLTKLLFTKMNLSIKQFDDIKVNNLDIKDCFVVSV